MLGLIASMLLQSATPPPDKERCFLEDRKSAVVVLRYIGDRACVDFMPPRQITGVWIDQFEGSSFHENVGDLDGVRGRAHTTWLTIDKASVLPGDFKPARKRPPHAYRLTFVGRTARDMNRKPLEGYGHFGMSPGLVLVDRLLSAEDLGPIPDR